MSDTKIVKLKNISASKASKIADLQWLIFDLKNTNEDANSSFIEAIREYESKLHLYLVEERNIRTIMRLGADREIILANNGFRDGLKPDEWLSYLQGRKKDCIQVLEEMLKDLEE